VLCFVTTRFKLTSNLSEFGFYTLCNLSAGNLYYPQGAVCSLASSTKRPSNKQSESKTEIVAVQIMSVVVSNGYVLKYIPFNLFGPLKS